MKYGKAMFSHPPGALQSRNPFHCATATDETKAICSAAVYLDKDTLTETEPAGKDMCMNCRRGMARFASRAVQG
jgi:hypothetical protein